MNAIRAIWSNGHIVPADAVDWPEGSELAVEPVVFAIDKVGLTEAEWRDDSAALADWQSWLPTVEPAELSDEERQTQQQFDAAVCKFNLEASRQQMRSEEGP